MSLCDQNIFKKIYFQWNAPLQRFLQSKGLSASAAADLVQESFIRLWKNCSKVSFEKAKAFLFKASNNLFIDDYRKKQTAIKLQQIPQAKASIEDGQYAIEMKEFQAYLEEAIETMTPASKEVFILHRFSGMSYQEIANSLELSIKSVEKRMSKALKHLATRIKEW